MAKPLILIVEDEGLIALNLIGLLTRAGYQIADTVASGEEALERFSRQPYPGLVVMDISLLGELDGIETVRRMQLKRVVPIIFITAHPREVISLMIGKYPRTYLLVKPVSDDQILSTIEKATGLLPEICQR